MIYTIFEYDERIEIRPALVVEYRNPPRYCPSWRGFFKSLEEAKNYTAAKCGDKPLHIIED